MKSLTIKTIINFKKIIFSLKIFIISIIMCFILIEILLLPVKATNFAGGSGTEKDLYLVETAKQLDDIRNFSDKYFKQISDIDLIDYKEGKGWNPISFVGVYNGNNKKFYEQMNQIQTTRFSK